MSDDDMAELIADLKDIGIEVPDEPDEWPAFVRRLLELRDEQ